MNSEQQITREQRRQIFQSGKMAGEFIRRTVDESQLEETAIQIAHSNAMATLSGDQFSEAYSQGEWHGFDYHELPLSALKKKGENR